MSPQETSDGGNDRQQVTPRCEGLGLGSFHHLALRRPRYVGGCLGRGPKCTAPSQHWPCAMLPTPQPFCNPSELLPAAVRGAGFECVEPEQGDVQGMLASRYTPAPSASRGQSQRQGRRTDTLPNHTTPPWPPRSAEACPPANVMQTGREQQCKLCTHERWRACQWNARVRSHAKIPVHTSIPAPFKGCSV